MLVKSHSIWNDLAGVQNEFGRIFHWSFANGMSGYYPAVNIAENDDAYVIEARVPGLAKEDVFVELEGRKLTIRGEHKREVAEYGREERASGEFERTISFKHPLAQERVNAEVKDGILTVTLPKAEEAKPRKIEIVAK
jgi:HSP20 family protein